MFYLAQMMSIIAIFIAVIGLIQKDKNKVLLIIGFSNIFITLSYYFLGAETGFYLLILATLRMFVFYYIGTRKDFNVALSVLYLLTFEILQVVASVYTWEGILTFIELTGFTIYTYGCWQKNKTFLLYSSLYLYTCHIIYNLFHAGYFNILLQVILISACIYSLIRDRKKSK